MTKIGTIKQIIRDLSEFKVSYENNYDCSLLINNHPATSYKAWVNKKMDLYNSGFDEICRYKYPSQTDDLADIETKLIYSPKIIDLDLDYPLNMGPVPRLNKHGFEVEVEEHITSQSKINALIRDCYAYYETIQYSLQEYLNEAIRIHQLGRQGITIKSTPDKIGIVFDKLVAIDRIRGSKETFIKSLSGQYFISPIKFETGASLCRFIKGIVNHLKLCPMLKIEDDIKWARAIKTFPIDFEGNEFTISIRKSDSSLSYESSKMSGILPLLK